MYVILVYLYAYTILLFICFHFLCVHAYIASLKLLYIRDSVCITAKTRIQIYGIFSCVTELLDGSL